jgi:hypothetical protein
LFHGSAYFGHLKHFWKSSGGNQKKAFLRMILRRRAVAFRQKTSEFALQSDLHATNLVS